MLNTLIYAGYKNPINNLTIKFPAPNIVKVNAVKIIPKINYPVLIFNFFAIF